MKNELIKVSLRQNAIYLENKELSSILEGENNFVLLFAAQLAKLGYTVSEKLLNALHCLSKNHLDEIVEMINEAKGAIYNWTPLVKQWDIPTGESVIDHIVTFFYNVFEGEGTKLECGHIIPANTFDLSRYNGCPFCGKPFEYSKLTLKGQNKNLVVLDLWSDENIAKYYVDLLSSATPLDPTQLENLQILFDNLPLPENITNLMVETRIRLADLLLKASENEDIQYLFQQPNDILRFLWFNKTENLRLVKPKTILKRVLTNNKSHLGRPNAKNSSANEAVKAEKELLKLKYDRNWCKKIAGWINGLTQSEQNLCENMHTQRNMWVRVIRAARLVEYSKKTNCPKLKKILEVFHNESYTVWMGEIDKLYNKENLPAMLKLLQQRPGMFSRMLFAVISRFGYAKVLPYFIEVIDKVPLRLLFTLNSYAELYFNVHTVRMIKTLGGYSKKVPANPLIRNYKSEELKKIKNAITDLCVEGAKKRYEKEVVKPHKVFIEKTVYNVPISIGDRSETVQDFSAVLQGQTFQIQGDTVRLFMNWGYGLDAQPLDMDLYSTIIYRNETVIECYYGNLVVDNQAKYSGDIREIPDKVGTAEYIELSISELKKAEAKGVIFSCKAYNMPALTMNLIVGWMSCETPMVISPNGVAYDPSCVQHSVRVKNDVSRGMIFGYLDVDKNEIMWIELPIPQNNVGGITGASVMPLINKLMSKLTVGKLLELKVLSQKCTLVENPKDADVVYDAKWASNTAAVSKFLLG